MLTVINDADSQQFRLPGLRRGVFWTTPFLPAIALIALGAGCLTTEPDELLEFQVVVQGKSRDVQVEFFSPMPVAGAAAEPRPAVIMLHGVEGAERYAEYRRGTADWLRGEGFAVFVVHYFDVVDYEDLWLLTREGEIDVDAVAKYAERDSKRWRDAIVGVIQQIASRPDIDAKRIVLDGYSLGGFISLDVAQHCQQCDETPDLRAVIVNWGASYDKKPFCQNFPATFFVHGELDQTVPLAQARDTLERLKQADAAAEMYVIPAASHVAISAEAQHRILQFLKRQTRLASPCE